MYRRTPPCYNPSEGDETMRDDNRAALFDGKADAYAAGRAGYAAGVFERIGALCPSGGTAADAGSGTGIFTEALLRMGYKVYGVEANPSMRAKAEARLEGREGFSSVDGTAERTGLPDGSVGFVTAASAFHWFDAAAFRAECRRILTPGGLVFITVNVREDDGFALEQAALCRRYCPGFVSLHHGGDETDAACSAFFAGGYEKELFDYDLRYAAEAFVARSMSSSYSPGPDAPEYAEYRTALAELADRRAVDGHIIVRNKTALWYGQV